MDSELKLIGYARVSTEEQRLDLQLKALREAGCEDDHIHIEKVSGTHKWRPALELAIKDLRPGETFVVWRLDRIARSARELYARLDQIYAQGGKLRSLTEDFAFDTITGRFVLGILALVAQLEREIISQRTTAGMQAAISQGLLMGRKRIMTEARLGRIAKMLKEGRSVGDIADKLHVAKSSIYGYFSVRRGARGQRIVKRRAGTE